MLKQYVDIDEDTEETEEAFNREDYIEACRRGRGYDYLCSFRGWSPDIDLPGPKVAYLGAYGLGPPDEEPPWHGM